MRRALPIFTILLLATAAWAEPPLRGGGGMGPGPHGPGRGGPEFREHLIPPQLVLRHQIDLGITEEQLQGIKKLINESHSKTIDLQIDLQRVSERLGKIVAEARVDEAAALGASDEAMAIEAQIKKAHLALLVRVKNLLTAEQFEKAKGLRPGPEPPD